MSISWGTHKEVSPVLIYGLWVHSMECRFILLLQFLKLFYFIHFIFCGVVPSLCVQSLSSCGEQGVLFVSVHRLSLRRLLSLQNTDSRCTGSVVGDSWAPEHRVSILACGLSCPTACRIFLDQGSNPCPLHWQVNSFLWKWK